MSERPCLYLVVRGDLSPGRQVAQAVHAARQFAEAHPETEREWFESSNTLAVLSVPDVEALLAIRCRAEILGLRFSLFREPDLRDEPTALALEPSRFSRRLCHNLRLALSQADSRCTDT